MGEMLKVAYESKVDVDMSKWTSDEAKDLRVKMRECQNQMEYLAYKHNLYLKEFNKLKSDYEDLIGVVDDKSIQ